MARNLLTLGNEFQVNLVDPFPRSSPPFENGVLGGQVFPSAALLANGNFVVVYQNDAGGQGDQDILSVEFAPDGTVVRAPFRVDFDATDQTFPAVAARPAGGYVAVWEEETGDSIHLVSVTSATLPNPAEFTVADFTETLDDPSISAFANGTFIVTYTREYIDNDDVWFAIVNANGNGFVNAGTGLVTSIYSDERAAKVATSGDIAAIVFMRGESSSDIALSIIDSNGNGDGKQHVVANVAASTFLPDVAALADGRFLVTWTQAAASYDIMGRIYDPKTGDFSGAAFVIASGADDEVFSKAAGLPDGGFVATWTRTPTTGNSSIEMRRFDGSGNPVGDAFAATEAGAYSTIAATKDGIVFGAWIAGQGAFTTDLDGGIQGRLFEPATETVNGTPGDDTITTYGLSEPVNGLAGKDTIDARGGNDVISGGEGKDRLTGGEGTDSFRFDVKLKGAYVDRVTDFVPGVDNLVLDREVFKKLKVGDLKKSAFFAGNKIDEGKDGKDLVVYDKKSGKLFYDADGSGGADAKLVAILDGSPNALKAGDIIVVA